MADTASLRRKPSGRTLRNAVPSGPADCFHPGGDVGVGVVMAAGEYCLVATRSIPAGQTIFRIEGDLVQKPSRHSVQTGYQLHVDLSGVHTTQEILDRYFWRFMNHSCEPSAQVHDRDVIALRNIEPWEPVTFNYNTTEWEMAEPFPCACGSRECLGSVQGLKFLTAAQRAKLGPLPEYLGRYLIAISHR